MTSSTDPIVRKGTINKCPSCGAQLAAFVTVCGACGHEFTDIEANRSITALSQRFDELERDADANGLRGRAREQHVLKRKARLIRDFPVPNARDDLHQLLHFIRPKLASSVKPDLNLEDWRAKFDEVLGRARAAYKGETAVLEEFNQIEQSLQTTIASDLKIKAKRNPLFFVLLGSVVLAGGAWAANVQLDKSKQRDCENSFARSAESEGARLQGLHSAATRQIGEGKVQDAMATAKQLQWKPTDGACNATENQVFKQGWDSKRGELTALAQQTLDTAAAAARAEASQEQMAREVEAQRVSGLAQAAADVEQQRAQAAAAAEQKQAAKEATATRKDRSEKTW